VVLCLHKLVDRHPSARRDLIFLHADLFLDPIGTCLHARHKVEVGFTPRQAMPMPEAEQRAEACLHASLLKDLALSTLLEALTSIDQPAWKLPIWATYLMQRAKLMQQS